ncbi:MAG TPA: hypothetical protein VLH59_05150 [Ignavibacteriaceae bacterium]|nr:hypothetical protein [Ignavibacteriaceae bacterium]
MRCIKLKIDTKNRMTFFHIKILLAVLLLVLITSCKDASKTEQQSDTTGNTDSLTSNDEKSFLFLTEWFDKVGVYKYDLTKKKYSTVWWHPRENVVMLVYKPGGNPAYFLTSEKMGMRANFPFFNRLKLFIISHDLSETKQIDNIGSGLQFTTRWNDDENLEVIYTSIDKTIASYVNQYTKVYDHYGKLIDSEVKTFDIEKSGFPQLIPPRNSSISPSGKYGVSFKSDSVFLKIAKGDTLEFIAVMKHSLNKLKWSDNEEYLFISTLDLNNETIKSKSPETSELFIYSLQADSLIDAFGGAGLKNFFTLDDILIFDDGFDNNSIINIYDLNQKKIVGVIKPREGCGLVTVPMLPAR